MLYMLFNFNSIENWGAKV